MYLRAKGNFFTQNLYREIEALTDRGVLSVNEISYDKTMNTISLPVTVYELVKKRKLFGTLTPYKRDRSKAIKASVVIRNIIGSNIENNCSASSISQITMLFGLQVKGNEISICSAEEASGNPCFTMLLTVSEIDIELTDREPLGVVRGRT